MNVTSNDDPVDRPTLRFSGAYPLLLAAFALLLLGGAEAALRMIGIRPWEPSYPSVRIEPGGKLTQPHPILGYSAIPGSFSATDDTGGRTRFTHLPSTLRITRPLSQYADPQEKPQIWIFGCSFTYGAGLEDSETFPWRLQERLPDREVVNFGMGGYGTIHSFLQLQEALKERSPGVVILAYASFHDVRNTFLRTRRKAVVPFSRIGPFVQPYARLDERGDLRIYLAETEYREFPLMRHSALVHLIESTYNELEQRWIDSRAVSEALVLEMNRLAREHAALFVVADISDGKSMLQFAAGNGIATIDITPPPAPRFSLGPHDHHPSSHATRIYADRLERLLRSRR